MHLNKIETLCKADLDSYKAFKSVINMGDFSIKGNAVTRVAFLMKWYDSLESKLQDAMMKMSELEAKRAMAEAEIKPIEKGKK